MRAAKLAALRRRYQYNRAASSLPTATATGRGPPAGAIPSAAISYSAPIVRGNMIYFSRMETTVYVLRTSLDWLADFGVMTLAAFGVCCSFALAWRMFRDFYHRHSRMAFALSSAICIAAAIYADKFRLMDVPMTSTAEITSIDMARGFILSHVSSNSQFSIPNSQFQTSTNLKWKLRGAYEDWFALPAEGWNFPFRSGWMDVPAICAWGEVRPSIGETNALPPLVPFKVSLAPEANRGMIAGNSQFWHCVSPSNSLMLTWENALVERCPTNLVSFQAEFFADGRFEYRRQDGGSQSVVVESYMPVFPFDYDGDGLENSVDPEPYDAGPDAHGTNAEWYNTVCSNVLGAVEGEEPNEPEIAWKEGVVSTAYYFVYVVASRGPAAIYLTGNAENDLGDLAVVALTAATNHVPLLMGVDYAVTATADFEMIPPDDGFAEVSTNDEGVIHVKWPVGFQAMNVGGNAHEIYVVPVDPGGDFAWDGASSMRGGALGERALPRGRSGNGLRSSPCLSSAFGPYVSFSCGGNCGCGGGYATGTYRYEGLTFGLPLLQCGCTGENSDDPVPTPVEGPVSNTPPSVASSARAVIFEDRYENSPGEWVDKRSTSVTLTITVDGGTDGGTLNVYTANMDKLNRLWGHALPTGSVSITAGYTMEWIGGYEALEASGAVDDIEIVASFTPNGMLAMAMTDSASLTSVKVEFRVTREAPSNCCTNRHKYGVNEFVACAHEPMNVPLTWDAPRGFQFNADDTGFWCPFTSAEGNIDVLCRNARLQIPVVVKEPENISCTAQWDGNIGLQGVAGDMVMYMTLYVEPRDVSFQGLQMQEVPDDTDRFHEGYFDDKSKGGEWSHNYSAGAGWWHEVKTNGYWTVDNVGVVSYPQPWTYGRKVWHIPVGWGDPIRRLIKTIQPDPTMQEFVIDANGTVTIRKYNHELKRSTSCDVWFDGVKVN